MPFALVVPDGYGYVVLVALGVIPLVAMVQGSAVTTLRGKAGVKYPNAYATDAQAKENKAAYKFNCAQRAHGNLLENMHQTVLQLLFGGLFFPRASAILGLFWALFRASYAYGYINSTLTENGGGRRLGYPFWIAQLGIWGCCIAGAIKMV